MSEEGVWLPSVQRAPDFISHLLSHLKEKMMTKKLPRQCQCWTFPPNEKRGTRDVWPSQRRPAEWIHSSVRAGVRILGAVILPMLSLSLTPWGWSGCVWGEEESAPLPEFLGDAGVRREDEHGQDGGGVPRLESGDGAS